MGQEVEILHPRRQIATYITVNAMAADGLATEGARISAALVMTHFSRNIPVSVPEVFIYSAVNLKEHEYVFFHIFLINMFQRVEVLRHAREGPIYFTLAVLWLLMPWLLRIREPGMKLTWFTPINSLAPGRSGYDFQHVIFKLVL